MIYLLHHLGLGDHIICNGLVRSVQKSSGDEISLVTLSSNIKSVQRMYRDNPSIKTYEFVKPKGGLDYFDYYKYMADINKKTGDSIIIAGFNEFLKYRGLNFDEVFYRCCNIPFSSRWNNFYYERDDEKEREILKKLNPSNERFIFVHDDPSRGYELNIDSNKMKVVKNDPDIGIFELGKVFESAAEIHCMESSIKCLIDSMPTVNADLYFYPDVRGFGAISKTTKNWKVKRK